LQLELLENLAKKLDVQMEAFILNKVVKFRGPELDHFGNLLKLVLDRFGVELTKVDPTVQWFKKPADGSSWLPVTVKMAILEKAFSEKSECLDKFESLEHIQVDFRQMAVFQSGCKVFDLKRRDKNGWLPKFIRKYKRFILY